MFKKFYHYFLNHPLLCLLIYGVVLRLFIYIFYNAITLYPDSKGYIDLSNFISNLSLDNYTGERTPGYPLLIALAGGNLYITAFFQIIIGLFNIVLFYDFSKMTTKSKAVSFWITCIMTSFIHILFFEFAILSETLTLFLVLLFFWFIEKFKVMEPNTSIKHLVILSVILSFLYITKPIYIYVPIGVFIFYLVKNYHFGFRRIILKATALLIVPLLSYYGWCSLNEKNMGYFASTYYLGVNLAQTATPFFEKASDDDKLIRDIMVKHRESNPMYKSESKNPMTVWYAWSELKEKTKLSDPDLSNELGRISKELFKNYPNLYLKQVVISWTHFWGASLFFWRTGYIKNKFVEKWAYRLWYSGQQYLLIFINCLFLLFSVMKIGYFIRSKFRIFDLDLLIVAIVISGSLAQALVVYGSNSRFCVPFFPLIVYFVITYIFRIKIIIIQYIKQLYHM